MRNLYYRSLPLFIALCIVLLSSCGTSNKVANGSTAFDLKKYSLAISLFNQEFEKLSRKEDKGEVALKLGQCYEKLLDYTHAYEQYKIAESYKAGNKATLGKAYMLKQMMRYDEAAAQFDLLKNNTTFAAEARQQIVVCKSLNSQLLSASRNLSIEPMKFSSISSDYGVSIYDNDFLVVSSDREDATGTSKYDWTGNKFSDLFLVDKESGNMKRFDSVINTDKNEGTPTFNHDYTKMIFVRCAASGQEKDDYCKLMMSNRINGFWTDGVVLPFSVPNVNYGQPAFFENDSVLIFSIKTDNEAKGYDLYYAQYDGTNYVDPYPLPESINTAADEHFPTTDGDTLYYSSNAKNGFGGLDIYKTWLKKDGSWQKPILLNYPYNTGADDFSYIIDRYAPKNRNVISQGYITSSRENNGKDQIYSFKVLKEINEDKKEEVTVVTKKDNKIIDVYVALKVNTPTFANNDPNTKPIGKKSVPYAMVSVKNKNGKEVAKQKADKYGLFLSQLNSEEEYTVYVSQDSFLNNSLPLSTLNLKIDEGQTSITLNKEILLEKIYRGKEIVLENIYYEYEKWDIRDDAKPSLDKLVIILSTNPAINIELGSHTDCRGDDAYNENLSSKRAQSAIDYLTDKGIERKRLSAVGYGERAPAVSCDCASCTEEQHQTNRRTSFKIL
jgi:peptidoglycan-associated lipoprotein